MRIVAPRDAARAFAASVPLSLLIVMDFESVFKTVVPTSEELPDVTAATEVVEVFSAAEYKSVPHIMFVVHVL
jgi:hypothetical protein